MYLAGLAFLLFVDSVMRCAKDFTYSGGYTAAAGVSNAVLKSGDFFLYGSFAIDVRSFDTL